jgi:hypothetical protein
VTEQALTAAQAAELINKPVSTLKDWRFKGKGPDYFYAGRHVRYWPADIRRWAKTQQRRTA